MEKQLIEGIDYYLKDGLFVFTEKYHLERGFCCESKGKKGSCKHCPYNKEKEIE